jgi:hypothetical protein
VLVKVFEPSYARCFHRLVNKLSETFGARDCAGAVVRRCQRPAGGGCAQVPETVGVRNHAARLCVGARPLVPETVRARSCGVPETERVEAMRGCQRLCGRKSCVGARPWPETARARSCAGARDHAARSCAGARDHAG